LFVLPSVFKVFLSVTVYVFEWLLKTTVALFWQSVSVTVGLPLSGLVIIGLLYWRFLLFD